MLVLFNRNHGLVLRGCLNFTRRSFSQRKTHQKSFYSKYRKVAISSATLRIFVAFLTAYMYSAYKDIADVTPITNRKRYIWMSRNAAAETWHRCHDDEFGKSVLNHDSKQVTRIRNIFAKIISSNRDELDVGELRLQLLCFESPQVHCQSLSDGKIYISTGILNTFTNDDELAFVLCHEVAHVLLNHSCEKLTREALYACLSSLGHPEKGPLAWWLAWVMDKLRFIELEADAVALQFLTKSGYRPGEAISWLKRMQVKGADYHIPTPEKNSVEELESRYPSLESRWTSLESMFVPLE